MRKFIILLISLIPFLPQAQEDFRTFDITETWNDMGDIGGWSLGNAWNESYAEYEYFGILNFFNRDIEMLSSKLRVYGDTINVGTVILRFPESDLIVEPTLGNIQQPQPLQVKMYPNPASGNVTFTGEYIERITVYDINSKITYRDKPRSETFTIDTSRWVAGIYIVQLWCDNQRGIFKKLIIK
jgi:hypothetical protein